jgi:uncharacterized protein
VTPGRHVVHWAGEELVLLGSGAIHWPRMKTVFVADLHLGKEAVFRARGLPIPEGPGTDTLHRLEVVLVQAGASRLVILGDLIHGPEGWTPEVRELLTQWKRRWSRTIGDPHMEAILIRGNHDRMAGDPPSSLGIQVRQEGWKLGPLALHHEPVSVSADPVLMGHLHPVFRLRGPGDRMRLPCFVVGSRRIVLPAFGTFTGGALFEPEDGDRVFVIGEGQVLEIPAGR